MNLKQDRLDTLASARAIIERAKQAGRDLMPSESADIDAKMTAVRTLDKQLAGKALVDSVMSLGTVEDEPFDAHHSDGGDLFSSADRDGFVKAAQTKGSYGTTVQFKAATFSGGLLPSSGTMVSPMPPGLGAYPLRSLFLAANAEGPSVRWYRMGAGTAAVVAEGGLKPDSGVTTTGFDSPLIKVAATFQVSEELAEDASFLIAAITRETQLGVLVKENQQIVAALAAATGTFTETGDSDEALDVVATAIGAAEARDGITPGALVLNPVDLANLRKIKSSSAYVIDPLTNAPGTVHGVPLVSSAATAAGTMWLVSAGAGVFYTRGGLRVDMGYNGDDWQRNLMTYRVEERVLPVVVRPSLVTELTLTTTP